MERGRDYDQLCAWLRRLGPSAEVVWTEDGASELEWHIPPADIRLSGFSEGAVGRWTFSIEMPSEELDIEALSAPTSKRDSILSWDAFDPTTLVLEPDLEIFGVWNAASKVELGDEIVVPHATIPPEKAIARLLHLSDASADNELVTFPAWSTHRLSSALSIWSRLHAERDDLKFRFDPYLTFPDTSPRISPVPSFVSAEAHSLGELLSRPMAAPLGKDLGEGIASAVQEFLQGNS